MSQLLPEIDVEVVKLVVTKKDNTGTLTYYFAQDYWATSTLYVGNPEILPLLASSPNVRRSVGTQAGVRHDVSIQLYAKTSMTERGKSLFDVLKDYEIHSADVTLLYYATPVGTITTHSDAVNIRQVLKVGDMNYSDDGAVCNLRARGVFFKDKEISKKLDVATFTDLDPKYDGEYGAIVFGEATTTANGIAIDSPIIDSQIQVGGFGHKPTIKVFSGFTFPSHPNKAFKRLLVKNQHKKRDTRDWLQLDLMADPQTAYYGNDDVTGGSDASLATFWRGIKYTPANSKAVLCNMITVRLYKAGTIAASDGDVAVELFFGDLTGSSTNWVPIGSALRTAKLNGGSTGFSFSSIFGMEFVPAIVLSDLENYFIRLSFTNKDDVTNYIYTKIVTDASYNYYALDKSESDRTWAIQSGIRLPLTLWSVGDGDDAWKNGTTSGAIRYSYYHLEGTDEDLANWDAGTKTELNQGNEFKLGITGLADDGSGTYTGSANGIIENPSDIIRFTLMNSDFGIGLSSTYVNTSSLDTVRSQSSARKLKIVLDRETTADQLINEVCRQSRIIYYQERAGKLALYYPVPISSLTANLSQAVMGGDLQLVSVNDNDYSSVVNDFRQYYKPDILNQPTDPALLRRDAREKLAGLIEMNGTTSTSGDTYRQGLCSLSQAKYGKRPMTADLSFHDSASAAQEIVNYYCDRYSQLQKRVTFRVPRRVYMNTLDLFSTVRVNHLGIAASDGTALPLRKHYAGDGITDYAENVPAVAWAGGVIDGQIYEVQEQGPWMILTAETVGVFA